MNNRIILVTHEPIANSFLKVLSITFGSLPDYISAVNVPAKIEPDKLTASLQKEIDQLPDHVNVLILADIFGATPCNLIRQLKSEKQIHIVTGLNLPMVIRAINYSDRPIAELAEKAYAGGIEGIIQCGPAIT